MEESGDAGPRISVQLVRQLKYELEADRLVSHVLHEFALPLELQVDTPDDQIVGGILARQVEVLLTKQSKGNEVENLSVQDSRQLIIL